MQLIDTHCHLYDEAFDSDRAEAVARAEAAGVVLMLLPDIDATSVARQEQLAESRPSLFREMVGLHPTSVGDDFEAALDVVERRLRSCPQRYVAVGEVGMDLYWDRTFAEQQREALRRQMLLAEEFGLPVALHIRKAHNEVFGLLRDLGRGAYQGVMHCFGGSVQEAQKAVEMGFHLGIGGVVTFKNATMADVVRAIPLERLLLETDAPYLAPVPFRGKRNESAFIVQVAKKIAEIKSLSLDEVAEQTTINARNLFCL
ncbi:MAG: TatD family hydrolase [Bacteroidales bacterium]|nr:TatD family hydrolase [Bacteroidales bacterium]